MKVVRGSKRSVNKYQTTRFNSPENTILHFQSLFSVLRLKVLIIKLQFIRFYGIFKIPSIIGTLKLISIEFKSISSKQCKMNYKYFINIWSFFFNLVALNGNFHKTGRFVKSWQVAGPLARRERPPLFGNHQLEDNDRSHSLQDLFLITLLTVTTEISIIHSRKPDQLNEHESLCKL